MRRGSSRALIQSQPPGSDIDVMHPPYAGVRYGFFVSPKVMVESPEYL
jgi:hypothetical protein